MQIGLRFDDFTAYAGIGARDMVLGNEPLQISAGPHGEGRFDGDVARHIFVAEATSHDSPICR